MNVLLVLAHPDKSSFNHAIADSAREELKINGHHVIFHDLYDEGFDPILPAKGIPSERWSPKFGQWCKVEATTKEGLSV